MATAWLDDVKHDKVRFGSYRSGLGGSPRQGEVCPVYPKEQTQGGRAHLSCLRPLIR